MKVKKTIGLGWQRLEVADDKINTTSHYGSPIVLAAITHYHNSGLWYVEDYRLSEALQPTPYLSVGFEIFRDFGTYKKEDQDLIVSKLHDYKIDKDGALYYSRFDCIRLDGDIPLNNEVKLTPKEAPPKYACFTFKEAQKKLMEAQEFWSNYEGSLTDEAVRLPNNYRQPFAFNIKDELSFNKERIEKMKGPK